MNQENNQEKKERRYKFIIDSIALVTTIFNLLISIMDLIEKIPK